ncbi:DUF16 domain-containing protein [Mycoplasmoides pneumoniae]|uniref:DUF16 domain-containing protein n=1 Tax=Mycoplasmoides pneumoniae TaxID=2104 RepID=UPI0036F3A879
MFKRNLKKDKIKTAKAWIEDLSDGSYNMGFYGNLNHMEKSKSGYVTHKQLDKKLEVFKQELLVEFDQRYVTKAEFKEFQIEVREGFRIQGEAMNARMDRFESLVLKSLESINNTLIDFGKRIDKLESK